MSDLNNALYEQLEKLQDASNKESDCENEQYNLDEEVKRSNAMVAVASKIIDNNKTAINAMRLMNKGDLDEKEIKQFVPKQLGE